jgi:hypothetical protein
MAPSGAPIALRIAISRFLSSTTITRVAMTLKAAITMMIVMTNESASFCSASAVKRLWLSDSQSSVW